MTLQQALDHFILDREAQNLSPRTIQNYSAGILAVLGDPSKDISTITTDQIKQNLSRLTVQASSKQTYLKYLRAFYTLLLEDGMVQRNPMDGVKSPRTGTKVLDALNEKEVSKILASKMDQRERALFMVLLDTGMRVDEASRLKVGQFDRSGGAIILGKGDRERYVQVGKTTLKALRCYERTLDGSELWQGRQGPLGVRSLRLMMERVGDRVGISLNPHKIRRTTTITMLRNGCDLHSLASVLGHQDIAILRQYLPLVEADSKSAYDRFGVI